jgi:7-cyano-7-deazaguanine synthase
MKSAVVLLSGGLDSATTLAVAKEEGYEIFALSFRYGQRHEIEIGSAKKVAKSFGVREHRVLEIDLRGFGGSALTDAIEVPKNRRADKMARRNSYYLRAGAEHNLP